MIEALMALAAVSDPDRAVTAAPVDLSAVVREGCEFLAPVAVRAGVALDADIADGVVVIGEEAALQRMVANLLSNAVKYTREGGRVAVTLEAASGEDDSVRLTCADTGIGISEADLAHVFTPFFRSGDPAARARPGTGLGLSILERVVRAHDGIGRGHLGGRSRYDVRRPAAARARRRTGRGVRGLGPMTRSGPPVLTTWSGLDIPLLNSSSTATGKTWGKTSGASGPRLRSASGGRDRHGPGATRGAPDARPELG